MRFPPCRGLTGAPVLRGPGAAHKLVEGLGALADVLHFVLRQGSRVPGGLFQGVFTTVVFTQQSGIFEERLIEFGRLKQRFSSVLESVYCAFIFLERFSSP